MGVGGVMWAIASRLTSDPSRRPSLRRATRRTSRCTGQERPRAQYARTYQVWEDSQWAPLQGHALTHAADQPHSSRLAVARRRREQWARVHNSLEGIIPSPHFDGAVLGARVKLLLRLADGKTCDRVRVTGKDRLLDGQLGGTRWLALALAAALAAAPVVAITPAAALPRTSAAPFATALAAAKAAAASSAATEASAATATTTTAKTAAPALEAHRRTQRVLRSDTKVLRSCAVA